MDKTPREEFVESLRNREYSGLVTHNDIRKAMGINTLCNACKQPILIQIFKGSDWCSDDCRKVVLKSND